ncbi:hypothetical protein ACWDA7_44190 [Streptomyces sp. NPDC001156]
MSDLTDHVVGRCLDQHPEQGKAYALDPVTHHDVEVMRRTLDAAERAMDCEGVPEEARRRVVNQVVWGEPEGLVDVHARVREQILAAFDLLAELVESWEAIAAAAAGPARRDEEPTT